MKVVILVLLVFIVLSLASALFFLYTDRGGSRTARALTVRVGLSILLFVILVGGYYLGVVLRS